MIRFTQFIAAVMLLSASCGSQNTATNGAHTNDTTAVQNAPAPDNGIKSETPADVVLPDGRHKYPDPWQESYKTNHVLYALSWQYQRQPGVPDKLMMHDSTGYDANGKAVITKKNTVVKYSGFDDNGYLQNVAFEGSGVITVKYYFTYTPVEGANVWKQTGYSMKNKEWKAPNSLKDTLQSYPPVFLKFDKSNHLISEEGAGQNIRYTYHADGKVKTVTDSSANTLKGYKGAFESHYTYNDAGQITNYRSYVNGSLRDVAVFKKPGLPDTMKVINSAGQIEIYRVFKYKMR